MGLGLCFAYFGERRRGVMASVTLLHGPTETKVQCPVQDHAEA